MADNELLIKINADAKNATKAFEDIKNQTDDLEDQLKTVGKISAVAFAALTAEVGLSVKAFEDSQRATRQLTSALQNQGLAASDLVAKYREYATAIQDTTGLDDDQIVAAQAVAQGYLGQIEITKELTQAIADLAEKKGIDLASAATLVGRTIGTTTNALAREGLELSSTASRAERYQKTLEFIQATAGGFAESTNQGVGSIRGLRAAFSDFQEQIGARFAPIIEAAIKVTTDFFKTISSNPALVTLVTSLIGAGLAISAIGIGIPIVVSAFTTLTGAVAAFGVVSNTALAGIPLIIGGIAAAITALVVNWNEVKKIFADPIRPSALGAKTGIIDEEQVKKDVNTFKDAEDQKTKIAAKAKEDQIAKEKRLANQRDANKLAEEARNRQIEQNNIQIALLTARGGSADLIKIKQEENQILAQLNQQKSAAEVAALTELYNQKVALELEQRQQDKERAQAYADEDREFQDIIAKQNIDANTALTVQEQSEIQSTILTERDAERKIRSDITKERIDARNKELIDRKKYGTFVATVNKTLASEEVQGAKDLSSELVALGQSRFAALRAIGKAAAIAGITISTAESVGRIPVEVQRVVPFPFNVPIIAALVGARIAFGAEQIAKVTAAQQGGLVEGGVPGRDSVPFLLEPGELVVPRRNFNDVVGAVGGQGNNALSDEILTELRAINEKFSAPNSIVVQGDVLSDQVVIDRLVRGISDAIEFRNARIVGVNA